MSPCPCIHVSGILQTENGTDGKWQLLFLCCKPYIETANVRLFAANGNGKRKFVTLGQHTINGNQRLLFKQTCPSMLGTILRQTLEKNQAIKLFPTNVSILYLI
jgi:hypothetical protein